MTQHLTTYIASLPANTDPLVVMSDVDEIPSSHTLSLLRACDFGSSIHLLLRNYLYSFEWYLGALSMSWRASVRLFQPHTATGRYRHSKSKDVALADSGWHCSFCFRYLHEFADKMIGTLLRLDVA